MAELHHRRSPHRLSASLAVGSLILLVLVGVVGVMLPLRCIPGLLGGGACSARVASATDTIKPGAVANGGAAPARPAAPRAGTAPPQPAPLPADSPASVFLAATFASLAAGEVPKADGKAVFKPDQAAVAASAAPMAPTTRVVSTTVIHPEPTPEDAPSAPAALETVASLDPAAMAPVQPETTPSPPIPAPAPAERLASSGTVVPNAASPASGSFMVAGSGVTVRSGPSRSRSEVFTLAPGQKVTVAGKERGWLHITDARGRSGWVYSSYLVKPNA